MNYFIEIILIIKIIKTIYYIDVFYLLHCNIYINKTLLLINLI